MILHTSLSVKTWKNEHFEFHGQCDLVMVSSKNFADGLGMDIHIRTRIVRFWSYIENAVVRIGSDIFEIAGLGDGSAVYWVNHEKMGELEDMEGFPIIFIPNPGNGKNIFLIDLSSKYPGVKLEIKTWKEFVGVRVLGATEEAFADSVGITGDFRSGHTYARDGMTVIDDFNQLGQEWQVLPSDGRFFHQQDRRPQFPEHCMLPEESRGERRRRLGEMNISEEQAEAACSGLVDEFSRKGCIFDVMATQDLGIVSAYG